MTSGYLTPHLTPSKPSKSQKSRARREPSGVFSLFQTAQIQQFKEAFSLIDQDGDGIVSEGDLKAIFGSLGKNLSPTMIEDLLSARPGLHQKFPRMASTEDDTTDRGVNFTMFLTMMGEHLFEFDTEAELIEAFESFDESDTGVVKCSEFRRYLSESGDRMDDEEIDRLLEGPFTDKQANFNYREWVKVLRVNVEEDDNDKR